MTGPDDIWSTVEEPADPDGEGDETVEREVIHPPDLREALAAGASAAGDLDPVVEERTVRVDPALDEDAFFSTVEGETTAANRYDLEKAVPNERKPALREVDRYWVNKPYAFVVIFHSEAENEKKYYLVEPHLNPVEQDLRELLGRKLRTSIKRGGDGVVEEDAADRSAVIERETHALVDRYGIRESPSWLDRRLGREPEPDDGPSARPEPAVLAEDATTLTDHQVEKLLYYLKRDFVGYERIDGIKHDINVEDISCDGYDSPVFVYHTDHEQVITNVSHGGRELDDFVVKLAQRSGEGISKRSPQVDATLPDGSRAQLTLGKEVSDHGTNYTIRQFKDVPFTPIDLVNWNTFSLEEMAYIWLCVENNRNLLFAGGTASGKTTSLNAVSLFIPATAKIVSIEDTREVELPQRNWIASVTRPSFSADDRGDVDEFDLLEAALRQRPEYIVMGEVRGEEGRTLFQVMSTGHTTLTTFHADSVGEVIKRFTTDPINVSKTMFTALDLVSIQTSTRVRGRRVRRNKSLTEINHYDTDNDEVNVRDVYRWNAETDEFLPMGDSSTLDDIRFDNGWSAERLRTELRRRRLVLAYLVERGLNEYAEVAATVQAFINDPEAVLTLVADDRLEERLADLRGMESVSIAVDPAKEAMVPRPDPDEELLAHVRELLETNDDLLADYRGREVASLGLAAPDADGALAADGSGEDGP